ncbi:hypothetical protein LCGC14_0738610 [marine sediment metagenome]|uniref:Chain length determinant protein n=2 Tax=root TaxID=1 RepID=A0A831VMW7_9FLAO|nr:hypothetical protein [Pricia sp.]HEA20206.1 hypothetical protein [Pricia antarctica]
MTDNKPVNARPDSDEIDLGKLFKMIRNGFRAVFRSFLRFFLYLKHNFVILAILVFAGFAIGLALKFVISDEMKTEVIVKPNFDSKDYLYNVVEEIEANLKAKDTIFFMEMGIVVAELETLRIEIEQIQEERYKEMDFEGDLKYLAVLQNFKEDSFVLDAVKTEIQKKNNLHHRITFFYKNVLAGRAASLKLMKYIENNLYFNELKEVYNQNARLKVQRNKELIGQIDNLIKGYTENMLKTGNTSQNTLTLDTENGLDITGLLALKNSLVSDTERKKLELVEQEEVVHIINYGKNQIVRTPLYAQGITVIPAMLLTFFFIYAFIRYLNKKALEIEKS